MNLVDANVLIYAVNESDPRHARCKSWLDAALNGNEPVGFAWTVLLAFLRLTTKSGLFADPLTPKEAIHRVGEWMAQAPSVLPEPGPRHLSILSGFLEELGTGGNLVSDAHLAALAVEHRATVITFDNDFDRFSGVAWTPPAQKPRAISKQLRRELPQKRPLPTAVPKRLNYY